MSSQASRWRSVGRWSAVARWSALLLSLAAAISVAGCSVSSSSGGINFTLGLQGSTADNPAQAPTIASNGPDGEYAFVYDNQVWAHLKGASGVIQVTRLTLSNGATILWGPLVWSPSGNSLAFALVENNNTDQLTRHEGPIYYVNLTSCLTTAGATCPVYTTQATGSIYGHTYSWFNDDWLISGNGGGIFAYDISDPNGWRTWQLRTTATEQQDYNCGQPRNYGDVQVVGATLYYTCANLLNLGSQGAIGSATLDALSLAPIATALGYDQFTRDEQIAAILNGDSLSGYQVAALGNVYTGVDSGIIAGAWSISATSLVFENVGAVDSQHGTVAVTICATTVYSGGCDATPLTNVTAQPLSAHPQISQGPGGAIAFQGDALYLSGQKSAAPAASFYAPVWFSSSVVVATNILAMTSDASGVTRVRANLVIAQGGAPTTLIAGASDLGAH